MINSVRIKNFKAIRDSKTVRFTPLTVFIGNNGSGKSSIIEALETYQAIMTKGLDEAMSPWRGFEHITNKSTPTNKKKQPVKSMEFDITWGKQKAHLAITTSSGGNELFIKEENITSYDSGQKSVINRVGEKVSLVVGTENSLNWEPISSDRPLHDSFHPSIFKPYIDLDIMSAEISKWQFINLNPYLMGMPIPQKRSRQNINLSKDGSNIAEYLLSIYKLSKAAFDGIIETLQYVLPYATDLQTNITSELERNVYLELKEEDFELPGWLLSTGTLRILALLAVLRHPNPPPLIVIEEIENGLDPRTIHLIINEIRNVVEAGVSQIIITTHSPYLLDLLTLSHIVVVERDSQRQPIFTRPANQKSLQDWSKQFSPGKLYTMGQLNMEDKL